MTTKPKATKAAAALALTLLLAGCAGTGGTGTLTVTGNELGGRIPNGMSDASSAMKAATAHCSRYNKRAMLTVMQTQADGGAVAFECR